MSSKLKLTGTGGGDTIIQGNDSITTDQTFTLPDNGGEIVTAPAGGSVVGYQQGVWVPASAVGTCGPDTGPHFWWRIGNAVTIKANIKNFSDRTSSSNIEILGLPYNQSATYVGTYGPARYNAVDYPTGAYSMVYVSSQLDRVGFSVLEAGSGSGSLKHSALQTANSAIAFTVSYLTDDTTWTPINGATVS